MLVLTDDQRGAGRPTKENLLKALDWLVRDAKRGDALFFHYSGHGGQEDDPDGIEEDGQKLGEDGLYVVNVDNDNNTV